MKNRYIGKPLRRNEDARLLTGQALFVDDVHIPGMLHVAFLRSDHAHARIGSIDVSAALERPGVVAAYTAQDLGEYWQPGPLLVPPPPIKDIVFHACTQVPLARDKVRHCGEALAAVVATSRYIAEDALDDIVVDLEPLDAVVDIERALDPASPLIHEHIDSNLAAHVVQEKGRYETAAQQAHRSSSGAFIRSRGGGGDGESRGGGQLG